MSMRPFGAAGVLTVNSLLNETPLDGFPREDDGSYMGSGGVVTVCAHCRRTHHAVHMARWDWVPGFLRNDPHISHGLCPVCTNYYYGLTTP
jgi:hypothetical protein